MSRPRRAPRPPNWPEAIVYVGLPGILLIGFGLAIVVWLLGGILSLTLGQVLVAVLLFAAGYWFRGWRER